ncbi:MAG: hypothetical protein HY887_05750 [Deltaproteobacteria bacterium]|nr:hypothetical protein [Deltaproteobacteria bacterium]
MTSSELASLSLKITGIYSIISAIPLLQSLSQVFSFQDSKLNTNLVIIGPMASFGILLLIGIYLIAFSKDLAKKMVSEDEAKDLLADLSPKTIQSIAFSIVGLLMIVFALPNLVQLAAHLHELKKAGDEMYPKSIRIEAWAFSIGMAFQFILGILIFLGGRGLSSIWFFLQKLRPMKDL